MLYQANEALASEEKYKKYVEEFCVASYYNDFRKYYAAIVGLDIANQDNIRKFAYHRLEGDEIIWDDLFLYHNIGIETNRWICQQAIKALGYLGGDRNVCK